MAIRSFVALIMAVAMVWATTTPLPAEEQCASSGSKEQVSLLATMLTTNGFSDVCVVATLDVCSISQASLGEAGPASTTPLPAEEHAFSGITDQRSVISAMLVMTGHSRACVATALDVCRAGQVDSLDASLTEEAREVVQQVSAAVATWHAQLSAALTTMESHLSAALNKSESHLSAFMDKSESELSAFMNKSESFMNKSESFMNKSESFMDKSESFMNKSESELSAFMDKSESELSAFMDKSESFMDKSESEISAFMNKSESEFSAFMDKNEAFMNKSKSFMDRSESFMDKSEYFMNKSESLPRHCRDWHASGDSGRGTRQVYPDPARPCHSVTVVCDHTVDGGGWTVFQRRTSDAQRQNFSRTWRDYEDGFGDTDGGEFWLGLKTLHQLTSTGLHQLRIDLHDYEGEHRWAKYGDFTVEGPETHYRLNVAQYSGDAGDNLGWHNGEAFSTLDADHDSWSSNCAAQHNRGGWWYRNCVDSNLNGYQHVGSNSPNLQGIIWQSWKGYGYSLQQAAMMTRPA